MAEFGYEVPFDRVRPLIGKGADKLLPDVAGLDHNSAKARQITTRRGELFTSKFLPTLRAFPSAGEMLQRMRGDGLRLVVATSATSDELNALLEQAGLEELIEQQTSASDAEHSKPDPDIINAALRRGGRTPARVLMVGDTPYDVEAASNAGVGSAALRRMVDRQRAVRCARHL